MTGPRAPETLAEMYRRLVDGEYDRATRALFRAFAQALRPGSPLALALAALEERVRALDEAGERLAADDETVVEVFGALEEHLTAQRALLAGAGGVLVLAAARAGSQLARRMTLGTSNVHILAQIAPGWNVPNMAAVQRVIDYTATPAWRAFLQNYPADQVATIRVGLVRDLMQGVGPIVSARHLREAVQEMPVAAVNNKLRTLQLTALRDATAAEYAANAALLDYQVRIATFDTRVCRACLALHGTRLPIGARVDDHYQGRCTSVAILKSRPRQIETGEAWLQRQPEARQREMLGTSFDAWSRGRVQLMDFVGARRDPVFGRQIIEVPA